MYCPNCGTELSSKKYNFCPYCGQKLQSDLSRNVGRNNYEVAHQRATVKLILDRSFYIDNLSHADQDRLQAAINNILRLEANTAVIKITNVEWGRVSIHLELPVDQVYNLYLFFGKLANLGVSNIYLSNADLSGANLHKANLRNANLRNANLRNANLSNADLSGADLYKADLSNADLSKALLTVESPLEPYMIVPRFIRANLSRSNLSNADLSGANLYNADLSMANLSNANLSNSSLSGAILYLADLSNADLSRANLSRADLREADLTTVRHDQHTIWPDGFDFVRAITPVRF